MKQKVLQVLSCELGGRAVDEGQDGAEDVWGRLLYGFGFQQGKDIWGGSLDEGLVSL